MVRRMLSCGTGSYEPSSYSARICASEIEGAPNGAAEPEESAAAGAFSPLPDLGLLDVARDDAAVRPRASDPSEFDAGFLGKASRERR